MEDAAATVANNVAGAIAAALDWNSSPDARNAAVSYLESVKSGDVRILASTSFILVKKEWSSGIRLQAFKLLQHLVRLRWEELNPIERRNFAKLAADMISEVADPCEEWALKSQTSALVAEIIRREGMISLQELLPSLVSLSNNGPIQAELVSMMLRWLPEDITVHNEDLEGDRRRELLRGLTQSLPAILPLLYTLLERHFGAAINEAARHQLDIAKQHAAAVTSTLNAINAYAEWAPLPDLANYGMIHGCGSLLSSQDFRLHACEFFKLVSARKRPIDESASEFDSSMCKVVEIMMNVSGDFLYKSSSHAVAINDDEFEFAVHICESMTSLGSANLHCITSNENMLSVYLHQMLGYFQHFRLGLHFRSLFFWLALLRDQLSKPKIASHSSGDGSFSTLGSTGSSSGNERQKVLTLVNDDMFGMMLDISFQRLLKKEKIPPDTAVSLGALELWSDDFEGTGDFSQYRSRLLELIRFVSSHKPHIAATKVSERIVMIITSLLSSSRPEKDLAILESMQLALENVVTAVFDVSVEFCNGSPETQLALCRIFEGLLQHLLALKWNHPLLVEVIGNFLDALGPFLKFFPDAVGSVINKIFELLACLPLLVKDPATNASRHARLQICASFIRIAKAAEKSLLPHMKGIADTIAYLKDEGRLLRGEHNLLGEGFLIIASAAGVEQQKEALAWLLQPLSKPWMEQDWQNSYLSDPPGLVRLCYTPLMWSVFHTVTFFERALKRSRVKNSNVQGSTTASLTLLHPIASHFSWMLPPLLKLLRAMHSLWSPPVSQALPGDMKAAMSMSEVECTSLLGEVHQKVHRGALAFADGSLNDMNKEVYVEHTETDIRNWLRGIRDSGYSVLGLSTTVDDAFFKCLDVHTVVIALIENIESMEFRHMKQLIHLVVIPLVKSCPSNLWEIWLEKLLQPLLHRAQQALSRSWFSLLNEGRAKVPDVNSIVAGMDLKVEVMEEKLLRDLTREVCTLLSVIASPALNSGLPSIDHSGHVNRIDATSLKDLDAFASSSMVSFLLKHKNLALPALQICLEALKWTDAESMSKISSFSGVIVVLAILSSNVELREFVCRDLFYAIIQGLALESNAFVSADLVALCREIFIYLSDRDPAPRQILLSLPCIASQDLLAFEEAITRTASAREQKQHMRSLLLLGTGNKLKALAVQKTVNVITNVSLRPRSSTRETRGEEAADAIGLAAIM
ncbi:histone deacetylase [Dionaea muscipula]